MPESALRWRRRLSPSISAPCPPSCERAPPTSCAPRRPLMRTDPVAAAAVPARRRRGRPLVVATAATALVAGLLAGPLAAGAVVADIAGFGAATATSHQLRGE